MTPQAKILFVAKPNSENFIVNYANHVGALLVTTSVNRIWEADESGLYDYIIFEWANDLTARALTKKFKTQVIVRVHDHEVRKGRIDNIDWNYVDRVWFINNAIKELFEKLKPGNDTFFLPNAVDHTPFYCKPTTDKSIGLLSIYARTRKRIDRALDLMRLLPDWHLTIRTEPDNPDINSNHDSRAYIQKLKDSAPDNVTWEMRPASFISEGYPKEDVNKFFRDKAVVLSTSEHEGFHYALAEGALCGCLPVVFNWEFGYPRDFWKPYVHNSIIEMAEAIKKYQPEDAVDATGFVKHRFSPETLVPVLIDMLKNPALVYSKGDFRQK